MIQLQGRAPRVCIDPGHGGHDPGTVGAGVRESDNVLAMAKALAAQLGQMGIECYLTRTDDSYVQLSDRVLRSTGADCFVSLHNNAVPSPETSGILTLFGAPGGPSKALANYVHQALVKSLPGHRDQGMRASPGPGYERRLYVLAAAIVPAILVEPEFLSSRQWGPWLASSEAHKTVAYAVANGVLQFFKSLPGATFSEAAQPANESAAISREQAQQLLEDLPMSKPMPKLAATLAAFAHIPPPESQGGQGRRLTPEVTQVRGGNSRRDRKRR